MTTITDRDGLTRWLHENQHFPDVHALRMDPRPRSSGVPLMPEVVLEFAIQVDGGFEAGEARVMRHLELRARRVQSFWIEDPGSFDAEFAAEEGIAQLDTDVPGIQLMVPSRVQLVCESMDVDEIGTRTEIIQPWINDSEFAMMVPGGALPKPGDWIELLESLGVTAVWRPHGGEPVAAEHVPHDYSGWFLQAPSRLASGMPGIFFFNVEQRTSGFILRLQDHDPVDRTLWNSVRAHLADYDGAEFRTGTVRLSAAQWRQYLAKGYVA